MTDPAPRSPLAAALLAPAAEDADTLHMRQAIVRDAPAKPASGMWTVTIELAGTQVGPVPVLGWWKPTLNAIVQVLQQGPSLLVIGPVIHGQVYTTADTTPPPIPPVEPPNPPTVVTTSIAADATHSWRSYGWRTDNDHVYQGGQQEHRGYWFYGAKIAAAKGAGTIIAATVTFARHTSAHGVNSGANVRLGTHGYTAQPGGAPTPCARLSVPGTLTHGQRATFNLNADQIAGLNAGDKGVGLVGGALGTSSPDYLIAMGKSIDGGSGQMTVTVQT